MDSQWNLKQGYEWGWGAGEGEHWVVWWDEAHRLHSRVLKLDYPGSDPGFTTLFLVILVNLFNLMKTNCPHF